MQSHRAASVGSGYRPNSGGFPCEKPRRAFPGSTQAPAPHRTAQGELETQLESRRWEKRSKKTKKKHPAILWSSSTSVEMRHAVVYIVEIR